MVWLICLLALDQPLKTANPLRPKDAKAFALVAELTLGGEDAADEALFSATASVIAGEDGAIYVLDPGNYRVAIFDAKGKLKTTFGRRGQGPGEFDEPFAMARDPKGRIHVFDTGAKRRTIFDAAGQVVGENRFESRINGVFGPAVFANGHALLTVMSLGEDLQMVYAAVLFDGEMNRLREYASLTLPKMDWNRMAEPGFWSQMLADHFKMLDRGFPMVAPMPGGAKAVLIRTNAYEGEIIGPDGARLRLFEKRIDPKPFRDDAKRALFEQVWQNLAANPALSQQLTTAVFERALRETEVSPRLPPVHLIAPYGKGFAALVNYDPARQRGELDFFDADGRCIGQAELIAGGVQALAGSRDKLYTVGLDEDDFLTVTRYAVRTR